MNKGMYGISLPPNYATRVAPPEWRQSRVYGKSGTYTGVVVPQNVYQIMLTVWGAGGSGAAGTFVPGCACT
jgi:hypothetical protein